MGYSVSHCLLALIEMWEKRVGNDQAELDQSTLKDFSERFECRPHESIITKLHVHGFSLKAFEFDKYFSNHPRGMKEQE